MIHTTPLQALDLNKYVLTLFIIWLNLRYILSNMYALGLTYLNIICVLLRL